MSRRFQRDGNIFSALTALLVVGLQGCGDVPEPERLFAGQVVDDRDDPVEGALVALDVETWTVTDASGAFRFQGLTQTTGPVTATAPNLVGWTLDTRELTNFTARLRDRRGEPPEVATIVVELTLPASSRARTVFLSLDTGEVLPVVLGGNTTVQRLELTAPVGQRQVLAFAEPRQGEPGLWAPPITVEAPTSEPQPLAMTEAEPTALTLEVRASGGHPPTVEASMSCSTPNARFATARATWAGTEGDHTLHVFPIEGATSCSVVASFDVETESGPALHVAFVSNLDPQVARRGAGLLLDLPPPTPLSVDIDDGLVTWSPPRDAAVTELFVARDDGSGSPGQIVWSATTEADAIALPELPPEARAHLDVSGEPLFIRAIARFVPGLDIEDNWNWSTYHAYITSAWVPLDAHPF